MRILANLSIRSKLLGSILLTTSLALVGGFSFVLVDHARTFRRDTVDQTVLMARVIGDHSVGALAFRDQPEGERILARLEAVPGVEAARLYDAGGRLFASWTRAPGAEAPRPPEGPSHEFLEGRLLVFEPIAHRGEPYGTIYLAASTRPLEAKIRRHLLVLLTAFALLVLLSAAFALSLQRIISGPILRLAETARRVSRVHDYSVRAEKAGSDEIGALCDAFNEMLAELGRKNVELREKSDTLERLYTQEREVSRTLQELNEMKTNFLVLTSHETRTPLTVIQGYTEALLTGVLGELGPRQRDGLAACQRMVYRLVETVSNIQQMLEIQAGLLEARLTALDLRAVAREVLDEIAPVIEQRRLEAVLEAPEALPVTADKDKVEFVLVSLVQNAIKFTPDGGRIRVRMTLEPEAAHVVVEDTGIGLEPSEIDRIFQAFYPADDSLEHHRSGTYQYMARGPGLGLAIARRYVEAHGGRLWAESPGRGKGSRFHVVLPLVADRETAAPLS